LLGFKQVLPPKNLVMSESCCVQVVKLKGTNISNTSSPVPGVIVGK